MDAIDKLLAELKNEYQEPKPSQPQPQPQPQLGIAQPAIPTSPKAASLIDNLLDEVKADFAQVDAAEQLQRQQELEQERIRQEQLKAKQLAALKKQAEEWLAKLDPFSPEGLWFERFAEGYPSKLAAAIEYLQNN
ncbi:MULTISPECIES: salt stress protein, Slr1339 family [unclassified Tolypothrix]|uniref:Uncharacterized protein n=1 Tax=Microchaete diplosiphon TaxID=1197 RepID=Q6H096_MICDP|nr:MULTISPECIES: hypothetical protein [unclassified Tolypothrix]AAT41873.1 hypothetical protein [Fremyella diplosiphon Fd33]BAY94805.1 hypothetical protein NIES3275_68590 [Microchaete diplosiphon NIES-3275]EKE98948.1 hypothetical protein FDUTEX481_03136 [Tolypothrix sp. PCC 7601]MBE9081316.1 hypothetical protein [Tolypothrix sp. LEGE 11397]UYD28459.1 hypothetical protein HGR01_10710 [Tolypothrix sp. PCC 7712]